MLSKLTAKITKTRLNIPLVFLLSVIPDVDLLIPFVEHRGPFHSILLTVVVFVPFFVKYRKRASPYFAALIQHLLIGDYVAGGGIQLLWPLTSQPYGLDVGIESPISIALEWAIFLVSAVIMIKTKDIYKLPQPNPSNLILGVPTFTVLLPTFLAFPLHVPLALVPPHILYLGIFLISLSKYSQLAIAKSMHKKQKEKPT
ncbi:metal-dependent hydrolase [Candidatus Bathyarchaeota archaeon]|nr:metal-dependent hydrolase [Candidatus Bathyarchaeota archaeon]